MVRFYAADVEQTSFFVDMHAIKKGNKAVKGYRNINNKRANMSTMEMLTCVLTRTMIRCVYTVRRFYTGLYRSYLNDTLSVDALSSCCARKTTFPLVHVSRITDTEFHSEQKCQISHTVSFMLKNKRYST